MSVNITQVRNAQSLQPDNARMYVEVSHPDYGWVPYTIDPSVNNPSLDYAALLSLIGLDFTPYVAPTQEELDGIEANRVRHNRDVKLTNEVDPIVTNPLRWAGLTAEKQNEWTQYRTDLLNVPQQAGFPNTINWPTKPE